MIKELPLEKIDDLILFHKEIFGKEIPLTKHRLKFYLRRGKVLVSTMKEKLIGYIIAYPTTKDSIKILCIGVEKKFRRRKIGTKLIRKIFKWCTKIKKKRIWLYIREENKVGINFFKKFKFKVKERMELFLQKKKILVMEKILKSF